MNRGRNRLRAVLALGASVVALAGVSQAYAQADPSQGTVAEVVVTAEKRQQSLQDVPVAVSAFTSNQRDVQGITGIQDFVNFTPGMNYSGTDRVSLRGAGRNTFFVGNDPGVAAYADGFYSASSAEMFKSPLFVERTEILRGPQGTLYGRNAIGGALNIISARPSEEFSGELRGTVANYQRTYIEGVMSIPLAEHLRIKVGGGQDWQREGFIENIGPAKDIADIKRTYFEFQGQAELGEQATAWVRYSRSSWDDAMGVGEQLANLVTPYATQSFFNPLGTASLFVNPAFGYTVANPGVQDPYVQNVNTDAYGQLRGNHLVTVQLGYDLGWAQLSYIGGYQQYIFQSGGDYDYTSRTAPFTVPGSPTLFYPTHTTDFVEHKRYYSNEINLTSKGEGPLSWILGVYQYHEKYRQRIQLATPEQAQLAAPLTLLGTPAAPNPERNFADVQARLTSDAWAVFGQATYHFDPRFAVTAGLRYTKDEKDGFEYQRLILLSPLYVAGMVAFDVSTDVDNNPANGVQNSRELSNSWDAVTGTLNLDWTPNDDTLVYGKYSRGYKSGGFLLGTLATQPEAKQEAVNAYELGWKTTFGGRLLLNGALFFNDYQDLQLNVQQLNAAGTSSANNFVNVDAEAYGLELEATWRPIAALQITGSYGYLHTEITKGCCFYDPADPSARLPTARTAAQPVRVVNGVPIVFQDLKGSKLYQSPQNKFAANANYTFDFAAGALILSGTYSWTDSTIYQPFRNPAYEVPSYGVADFRAIWRDGEGRYTVIGFVKNAFDKAGYTSVGSTTPTAEFGPIPGPTGFVQTSTAITRGLIQPRTYGLELQYRF